VQVVGVDHPRARVAHGALHRLGLFAAAQQRPCRPGPPERRGASLQQLGRLAELLAHEPQQILHRPLLATGRAVAVV